MNRVSRGRSSGASQTSASAGRHDEREELREDPDPDRGAGHDRAALERRPEGDGGKQGREQVEPPRQRERGAGGQDHAAGCPRGAAPPAGRSARARRRQARWHALGRSGRRRARAPRGAPPSARRTATRRRSGSAARRARARTGTTIGTSANGGYSRGTSRYGREPAKDVIRLVEVQADVALRLPGSPRSG